MTAPAVQWTRCPECDEIAVIRERTVLRSTAGPLEHVRTICVARHTFLVPAAMLVQPTEPSAFSAPPEPASPAAER